MEIDCTVPCFTLFKILNSCPKNQLKISQLLTLDKNQIFELCMVLLSTSPYFFCFVILLLCAIVRTTRCIFLLMMIFIQNYFIELVKNILKDPRPNFACNQQYGNPSNHAVFYSSMLVWFLCEHFYLNKKYRFKYNSIKLFFVALTPFVLYSRIYLNYHKFEQIVNGVILGALLGYSWFMVVLKVILKSNNFLKKLFKNFGVINTITDEHESNDLLSKHSRLNEEFQALSQKQKSLSELKDKIKNFRENIEKMDFIKNIEKNKFQTAKEDFDNDLTYKIEEIMNKSNGDLDEEDVLKLNKYLNQIKKTE